MDKPKVFVITPFGEEFLALYDHMKNTFSDKFEFTNAGDLDNQQNILKDIVVGIDEAEVVIADLTGLNPNVFYELGIAHTMNKKVIIITQDLTELPFDIKSYRANEYSMQFHKMPKLISKLTELLSGAIDGNMQFGNPVFDFSYRFKTMVNKPIDLNNSKIEREGVVSKKSEENSDAPPGILDNIVEVEESIKEIGEMTVDITENMKEMSSKVEKSAEEIKKANKTGGSSVSTFARNISRKVSVPINDFAEKMENYNKEVDTKWNSVENNLFMYFDETARSPMKIEEVKSFCESLSTFSSTLEETDCSVRGYLGAVQGMKGFERRLNTATNKLELCLNNYLNLVEKMQSSIDRILSKLEILSIRIDKKD